MSSEQEIQRAQLEMLLKEIIGDLQRVKKKVQTVLTYSGYVVTVNEKKNKENSKNNFTA
jgi:hypothetical protein